VAFVDPTIRRGLTEHQKVKARVTITRMPKLMIPIAKGSYAGILNTARLQIANLQVSLSPKLAAQNASAGALHTTYCTDRNFRR
jgi:hypothetical protein